MAEAETQLGTGIETLDIPNDRSVAFDIPAINELIQAHGVQFEHFRGMMDPTGLATKDDVRRPQAEVSGGSNGMIYTCAGRFTALFVGQSKSLQAAENGVLDSATAQITPTQTYDGTDESVYLHPRDRLFLAECSVKVPHQQLVEHHATGRDRLRWPVLEVQDLVDNERKRWKQGVHFEVDGDDIVWGRQRPRPGQVYAVRFLFRPHWYVDRLAHETRVAQYVDPATGERRTARLPQNAVVKREHVYQNEFQQEGPRKVPGPREGSLGPR